MFYYFSGCFGVVTSVKRYLNFKSWDNRDKPLLLHIPISFESGEEFSWKRKLILSAFCDTLHWLSSFGLKSNFKLEVLWKVCDNDIILIFSHLEWLCYRVFSFLYHLQINPTCPDLNNLFFSTSHTWKKYIPIFFQNQFETN